MAEPADEFAGWLAAARAGSSEALGRVLEACRGYLLLVAGEDLDPDLRAKGGASDLVQQTFLEAQGAFGRFRGDSEDELLAWLRQLLRNNLIDFTRQYRATAKRGVDREVPLAGGDTPSRASDVGVPADTPSPSGHAMARERDDALRAALDRLPEDYRAILRLRYEDGLGFDAIATRLGRSAEAARKLWARAVARLQQEMDAHP
jgi:RNA polymerase sigma-70 factor (ECF subfamily)